MSAARAPMLRAGLLCCVVACFAISTYARPSLRAAGPSVIKVTPSQGLAAGLDQASIGDTIEMAPGLFTGKNSCGLTVKVDGLTIIGSGTTNTTVNCTGTGLRGIAVRANDVTLSDFTIAGGVACDTDGGGNVMISGGAGYTATLANLVVRDGLAAPSCSTSTANGGADSAFTATGGGISIHNTPVLVMSGVHVTGNSASATTSAWGGGMAVVSWLNETMNITMQGCSFDNNAAVVPSTAAGSAQGGGFRISAGVSTEVYVRIDSSAVRDNLASCSPDCNSFGGGAMIVGQNATFGSVNSHLTIVNSTFTSNTAVGYECSSIGGCGGVGGGVNTGMVTTFQSTSMSSNTVACHGAATATTSSCSAAGGAAFLQGAPFTVTGSTFSQNQATCSGTMCAAGGAAISTISTNPQSYSASSFSDNVVQCSGYLCQSTGGAISSLNYAGGVPDIDVQVLVQDSAFDGNAAQAELLNCSAPTGCDGTVLAGALGGTFFVQSVGSGKNSSLTAQGCRITNSATSVTATGSGSTAAASGSAAAASSFGLSAGGTAFALGYSGMASVYLVDSNVASSNSTCDTSVIAATGCYALAAVAGGVEHASGSLSGCNLVNNGDPAGYATDSDYAASLLYGGVAMNTQEPSAVTLTCEFLQSFAPHAGFTPCAFNSTCC